MFRTVRDTTPIPSRIKMPAAPSRRGLGRKRQVRYGVQAVTVTSSRNQPVLVTVQSVIAVKPMRTDWPAQPPVPPVAALQAASRSIVVLTNDEALPVNTEIPPAPVGGQEVLVVPL